MAAACALLIIVIVLLASILSGYPTADLVRDPSSVTDSRWWNGGAAMLNATLWGVAAALGGFVSWMHRTHRAGMLLYTALSLMLMFEDTFQIKDLTQRVVPGELPVLAVYAVTGLVCAWLLRPALTGLAGWTLIVAGVLLAVSIVVDQLRGGGYASLILLEFGPMFVGTALWASVPVLLHQQLVRTEAHPGTG